MIAELPQSLFDTYALALPRGHGFGNQPPIGAWQTSDHRAYGVITQDAEDKSFGYLVARRRIDSVWTVTAKDSGFENEGGALARMRPLLREGEPAEPMPRNMAPRPALYDLQGRTPSDAFNVLRRPSHHPAAWMLNQLYLSLPKPDENWASDCQTANFHTRLWEAQLLASFREQGLLVTQPEINPDFRIENRLGGVAWVEAVTANPSVPYNHVNARPSSIPETPEELFFGLAALRFAKTLRSKLDRKYTNLPHVIGHPFVIALADFQAPASMIWSREGLIGYLYGEGAKVVKTGDRPRGVAISQKHLLGEPKVPAGLFSNKDHAELSAIVFSNACSIAKLNRVAISSGAMAEGIRVMRIGRFFDRTPGAVEGIPFCLDITSTEYRNLWPLVGYEPWSAELEVFHNPHAMFPLAFELIPEATHWHENDTGEMVCSAFYGHEILWSQTWIQDADKPPLTLDDFLKPRTDPDP